MLLYNWRSDPSKLYGKAHLLLDNYNSPENDCKGCNNNSLQQQICWFNLGWVHILVFSNKKKSLLQIFYASRSEQSLSRSLLTWGSGGLGFRVKLQNAWASYDLKWWHNVLWSTMRLTLWCKWVELSSSPLLS